MSPFESLPLMVEVLAVLGLLTLLGLWPVLLFFPAREALRWPLFAPVCGLALIALTGLPASLLGCPVDAWAWPVCALHTGASVVLMSRQARRQRRAFILYVRSCGLRLIFMVVVVSAIATGMMTRSPGSSSSEVWGSGDFGAYWLVGEYLEEHAASWTDYQEQTRYRAPVIEDHLILHARLGCMTTVAFFGCLFAPEKTYLVIAPLLVACLILILGLALRWIERERFHRIWLGLPLLTYPFLYFLFYFTYLSQATGVLLLVAGLLLLSDPPHRVTPSRAYLVAGALMGASLLHYPSLLVPIAIGGGLLALRVVRGAEPPWKPFLWALALIVSAGYYLPQVIAELRLAGTQAVLPGWDWQSLIGALEFLGLQPVMGYELPGPQNVFLLAMSPVLGVLVLLALLAGARLSRNRLAAVCLLLTTCLLAGVALQKYLTGVPHASHAFVKVLSTFAVWLMALVLLSLDRLAARYWARPAARVAVYSLVGVLTLAPLASLERASRQHAWYGGDLITLARRQSQRGKPIRLEPPLHPIMSAPLVLNVDLLLAPQSNSDRDFILLLPQVALPTEAIGLIQDVEGLWVALDLPAPKGDDPDGVED